MKPIRKPGLISRIAFIAVIILGCFSCMQSNKENLPVLDMELVKNGVIAIDAGFHNYTNAECNFLKKSSALSPDDIQNVYCDRNDLYILFPDLFLHYDLISGNLLFHYKPEMPVNFVDFAYNKSTQQAYILDNKGSQVLEMEINGEILNAIKLDNTHSYSRIKHLKDRTFLIPLQTIPYPGFVTVDFEKDETKEYDFNSKKRGKAEDIPDNCDSIWIKYPLYVTDEVPQGILVKYLFDDVVYLCTGEGVIPWYLINMGKQKVKFKYPWSVTKLKNNKRFRIVNFWHTSDKTYIISQSIVKNKLGTWDHKLLSKFRDFKNGSSFIASNKLASLDPAKEEIFMDQDRKRFIGFRKLNKKEKKEKDDWPVHMLEPENEDDLVISIFTMK